MSDDWQGRLLKLFADLDHAETLHEDTWRFQATYVTEDIGALVAEHRSQLTAALAKVAKLEQELADVHALDAWAACEVACAERFEWTTGKVLGSKAPQWRVVLRGITLRPVRDFVAVSAPAARRAAVEYLKAKESK